MMKYMILSLLLVTFMIASYYIHKNRFGSNSSNVYRWFARIIK
jgi:hypothetical protein